MRPQLNKTLVASVLLTGALWITPPVSVQAQQYSAATSISERDVDAFATYLESRPSIARSLSENPDLINDRRFVRDNPSLRQWLRDNPRIARKIEDDPEAFIQRVEEENQSGTQASTSTRTQITAQEVMNFETYLNSDWETAQLLYQTPDLIKDRRFIRNHPDLRDWLEDNPKAAEAIQANPHKFLWRQRTVGAQDFLQQLLNRR